MTDICVLQVHATSHPGLESYLFFTSICLKFMVAAFMDLGMLVGHIFLIGPRASPRFCC